MKGGGSTVGVFHYIGRPMIPSVKMPGGPQRLKPNSLQSSYVRPKGRTLQRSEFFRNL
jgi:hypothetical protein